MTTNPPLCAVIDEISGADAEPDATNVALDENAPAPLALTAATSKSYEVPPESPLALKNVAAFPVFEVITVHEAVPVTR